jgi:hypothetical protein
MAAASDSQRQSKLLTAASDLEDQAGFEGPDKGKGMGIVEPVVDPACPLKLRRAGDDQLAARVARPGSEAVSEIGG